MRPIAYHSNLFALGTLSGSQDTDQNPAARTADGSISLPYFLTSGSTPTGVLEVTLASAQAPDALALPRAERASGYRFILESEDVGGGNNATVLDYTASGQAPFVVELSGSPTPRQVWRLTASGMAGFQLLKAYEVMLATKAQLPRRPIIGVGRNRVRQFTRLPVPGGEAFRKQDGQTLRETSYTLAVVSGSEVDEVEALLDALAGGESFYFSDDRREEYYAELPAPEAPFDDQAGVLNLTLTFREVRADL